MANIWAGESKSLTNVASGGKISTAKYTIDTDYIYVDTGLLSAKAEMYPMWAVRDIDYFQSLLQKPRRVSTIRIRFEHNDFTGKSEILLLDIEAGRELVPVLTTAANEARLAHQRIAQTQHVNYQGAPPMMAAPAATQPVVEAEDVYSKLEKLGTLVEKGLLTREEFDAQKAKLLGL